MKILTTAFSDGAKISSKYISAVIGGNNISPSLKWDSVPAGTKSFAISFVDHHPVANEWVHWLVINIPADIVSIDEGASGKKLPAGTKELNNTFGKVGYIGPQAPKNTGDHPYEITVYALSVDKLNLDADTNLNKFLDAIKGNVLSKASLTGMFGR